MDAFGYTLHLGDDSEFSARATYDVMTGEGVNLSLAYSTNDTRDNIEVNISSGPFAISATSGDGGGSGGENATCITGSYTINANWTLSVRTTDNDDDSDELMDIALQSGAWSIQSLESTDSGGGDNTDNITVGYMVSF